RAAEQANGRRGRRARGRASKWPTWPAGARPSKQMADVAGGRAAGKANRRRGRRARRRNFSAPTPELAFRRPRATLLPSIMNGPSLRPPSPAAVLAVGLLVAPATGCVITDTPQFQVPQHTAPMLVAST